MSYTNNFGYAIYLYIYVRHANTDQSYSGTMHYSFTAYTRHYLAESTANSVTTWNSSGVTYPAYLIGKGTVKNTFVNPQSLTTINFVQSYTPTGDELGSWDASQNADGTVTAYALSDGVSVTVSGNGSQIFGYGALTLLWNMNVTTITGLSNINTLMVTQFWYTFYSFKGTSLSGLESWNTNKVTLIQGLIYSCPNLTSVYLYWTTPVVTTISNMFAYCASLQTVQIYSLNTKNCTSMTSFFYSVPKLKTITVGSNFTRMGNGTTNLTDFPNPANYTGTIPNDAIAAGWRNVSTGTVYDYTAVPNLTYATYRIYGSDGRPTLATHGEESTTSYTSVSDNGSYYYVPYWLATGNMRASVSGTVLRSITKIETRSSYSPSGNEDYSWDASLYKDGRVHCYITGTELIIAGDGSGYIDLGQYASYTFGFLPNLTHIIAPHLNFYNNTGSNFPTTAKTTTFYWLCANSPNVQEIDISGLDFRNIPNYYWYCYVNSRSISDNVATTTMLTKLSKITVGDGYKVDCAGPVPEPTSGVTVVPSDGSVFDGSWHDETGVSYTAGSYNTDTTVTAPSFSNYIAHVYTAYIPYQEPLPTRSVWKVYNGTEWVQVEPQYYNGTSWVSLQGAAYNGSEWT